MFENLEVSEKLNPKRFPKFGSNRNVSEIDLRNWENLYMQSLKVLKKTDLFKNVADNISSQELRVEYYWIVKDFENLRTTL